MATRPFARMRGLLGRATLPAGEGILLRPAGSVHTFFMRFPIDVVFCDRDLRIVKVVRGLKPWRMAAALGAKVTIELAVGAATGLEPGDRLQLE